MARGVSVFFSFIVSSGMRCLSVYHHNNNNNNNNSYSNSLLDIIFGTENCKYDKGRKLLNQIDKQLDI
jgi:hypothetical protein